MTLSELKTVFAEIDAHVDGAPYDVIVRTKGNGRVHGDPHAPKGGVLRLSMVDGVANNEIWIAVSEIESVRLATIY